MTVTHPGITRSEILLRAKYGWPRKTVPFNRVGIHPPSGYRTDAPGYVSMCWDIPLDAPHSLGGMSTVTLLTDGWCREITRQEVLPGDAVGYLGPESLDADGGVVMIFEKWLTGDTALTWEHLPAMGMGPDQRARPIDHRWHCYRFRHVIDNATAL